MASIRLYVAWAVVTVTLILALVTIALLILRRNKYPICKRVLIAEVRCVRLLSPGGFSTCFVAADGGILWLGASSHALCAGELPAAPLRTSS